ncbi:hypothetical protein EDE15_0144 [Edaphobacter aggregans]|jgi:hypothetical protein|uniref:Uncharacterized protein n=1 Tax=Edaphobacter aggregans TaxID=570835 RepID=A0A3R9WDB8_9BACT|nr:hypothetical protein [Edaphobacter aggregans]RSL14683.1 hypothetical protein EDE15_0144 [Edaphobacter aggregans]
MREAQFEGDLGRTGDDGTDLHTATEKRFDVTFGNSETGIGETFRPPAE